MDINLSNDGDSNFVSMYLNGTEDLEGIIEMSHMFSIISCNPEKHINTRICWYEFTKHNGGIPFGWKKLTRDTIFNLENVLLKNDVLTVNCHMWKTGIDLKVVEDTIVSRNNNCSTPKKSFNVNERSSVTRINVESKSVLWEMERFSEMPNEESFLKTVASVKEGGPRFDLKFYMKESQGKRKRDERIQNHCSHLDIRRNNADYLKKSVFIRCKIKTLGSPKCVQYQGEDEHNFQGHGRDQIWQFPVFIEGNKIIEDNYLYYTDDVLYLLCKFTFSVEGDVSSFEDNSAVNSIRRSRNVHPYYLRFYHQQLYQDDEFSDVTIRTGDRFFKAHKCCLGTRSPVFRNMLQTDILEKETGVVEITDLDDDTVDRMITFIYTGILEEVNHRDLASLYCAANKYDVLPLKCRCRCSLMPNLSVDTVGEVLHLADMYQDEELLEAVRSFIHVNTEETFHSEAWKDFEINNFQLAAETTFRVLREKFLA